MDSEIDHLQKLNGELQNLYRRAKEFMVKPSGATTLKTFMPEVEAKFQELMQYASKLSETSKLEIHVWSKENCIKQNFEFEMSVKDWLETCKTKSYTASHKSSYTASRKSSSVKSSSTTSSMRSEKVRSRVKLKLATLAREQEVQKVHETRLWAKKEAQKKRERTIEEAEMKAREAAAEAEMKAREAAAEAEMKVREAAAKAKKLMEAAETARRKAEEEEQIYLLEVEKETEAELQNKNRELEYATVEAEAWDEVAPFSRKEEREPALNVSFVQNAAEDAKSHAERWIDDLPNLGDIDAVQQQRASLSEMHISRPVEAFNSVTTVSQFSMPATCFGPTVTTSPPFSSLTEFAVPAPTPKSLPELSRSSILSVSQRPTAVTFPPLLNSTSFANFAPAPKPFNVFSGPSAISSLPQPPSVSFRSSMYKKEFGNSATIPKHVPVISQTSTPLPYFSTTIVPANHAQILPPDIGQRPVTSVPKLPDFRPPAEPQKFGERLLPLPQIDKFDGNPMNYWTFVLQFNAHILKKVQGADLWLLYLIQHCEANVRSKISHLTSKDPAIGFKMAWEILFQEYGRSHEISRCCEENLKRAQKVNDHDPTGLKNLAILMDKCCTSLQHIDRAFALDSMDVLLTIAKKLPLKLQERWIERSVEIEARTGDRARFEDLSVFVNEQSLIANSIFSRAMFPLTSKQSTRKDKCMASSDKGEINPSIAKAKVTPKCICCNGEHHLVSCNDFKTLSFQEKRKFVQSKQLCFKCLKANHLARDCSIKQACSVEGCSGKFHHTHLHAFKPRDPATTACSADTMTASVYLNVVPVKVRYGEIEATTYAFLDQGSTTTFCEQSLVEKLKAKGEAKRLNLQTLTSQKSLKTMSLKLSVQPLNGGKWLQLPEVVAIDSIPIKPNLAVPLKTVRKHRYLQNISIPQLQNGTVQLLIGANVPEVFRVEAIRKGPEHCPDAVRTPLGWSLLGPSFASNGTNKLNAYFVSSCTNNREQFDTAQNMFLSDERDLDLINVDPDLESGLVGDTLSLEDLETYQLMKKSVEYVDGHYQLPLPWRRDSQVLPKSKLMAEKRLDSLKKRLSRNPDLRQKYKMQINSMIEKGYAEEVPSEEVFTERRSWYLPHHPVINPHKPEKVRIVFDCAAKCQGISINDALMQGPNLANSLTGVLTRFRKGPIAIIADVEAMFHQVRVAPRDRDCLRFLWWKDGDMSKRPTPHRMKVHLFGATSSPSCASFCLRQAATELGKEFEPYVTKAIESHFYVDDFLMSVSSVAFGKQIIRSVRALLNKAGFNLTKWLSNSTEIIDSIPQNDRSKSLKITSLDGDLHERVLGVGWNVKTDNFTFDVTMPTKPRTRRGVLSTMNSLFDPLGFVTPVILEARLIFRQMCRQELEWDEPMPDTELKRWEKWLASLPNLRDVSIPRCVYSPTQGSMEVNQLHFFSDASKVAYGAVCYLRTVDCYNNIQCSLIMGKSHLAPLDETSIPRLELMAALLSVKMNQMLRRQLDLPLQPAIFWTDSSVVLQSLHNNKKRFPLFVSRRLAIIARETNIVNWNHVPTKLNPADFASRGAPANALVRTSLWFTGPDFLREEPGSWPSRFKNRELTDEEVNQFNKTPSLVLAVWEHSTPTQRLISHFSSLFRLKKAVAAFLKLKTYLLSKKQVSSAERKFSVKDLQNAEIELIKFVQEQQFSPIIAALRANGCVSTSQLRKYGYTQSWLKINPQFSEGLLRVGGRLDNAPLKHDAKHPIILPNGHHLTSLMIRKYHEECGHSGTNFTWMLFRQRFWVKRGCTAVRKEIDNCMLCKKRSAPRCQQLMSNLPPARLKANEPPFSHVGVDYFGPFLVKRARSQVKRYGCVFSCLTTRAVHIEVAEDLTADAFICAYRRFCGRRVQPHDVYSDNGTNFVGAEKELKRAMQGLNSQKLDDYFLQQETRWHFNPPTASHMGGAWERMIRSIRRILGALINKTHPLREESLHTFLVEVERVLNSRPLTPVSFEPGEYEPITPNHLLLLHANYNLPPGLFDEKDTYSQRRWRQVQHLTDLFWKRWVREYLPNIATRQKWSDIRRNLDIDDLVLLVDDNAPRGCWRIGRVVKPLPDRHGIVRQVELQTQYGLLRRPISKLCLICESNKQQ